MERELTLEEKTLLIEGHNNWNTYEIKDLDIIKTTMCDGPLGLRKEVGNNSDFGLKKSCLATAFPGSINLSTSFNEDIAFKVGKAIGKECVANDVDILLAPGVNIKRNPRCGRNFEYFSEDPFVSGTIGASYINGLQSENILATCKHYCLNNSENYRYNSNSVVSLRALREIYLKPFEIIIKNTDLKLIMCSYNIVNNIQVSENEYLLNTILRGEFKFDGVVMSDWGATKDRILGLKAGLDLDMPGNVKYNESKIFNAIKNNELDESVLDKAVNNIININNIIKENRIKNSKKNKDLHTIFKENEQIALEAAIESAVLLKNENNVLPLKRNEKYLVVGELFKKMRYQGAGSSLINPVSLVTPYNAFINHNVNFEYVKGYKEIDDKIDVALEEEAINKAKNFDNVIIFAGLTDLKECEGFDRENINLSENQISLINKLASLNKHIVLVLYLGSQVIIPSINKIEGILNMFLPGNQGGEATYKLLFGESVPSGKLTSTWVKKEENIPFNNEFGKTKVELYKEDIFVGYRYYDFNESLVQFPFGFGLSYSKFEYSNLIINIINDVLNIKFNIKNIGFYKAKEVAEIYISNKNKELIVPKKELKAFKKVLLDVNESKEIEIKIPLSELSIFASDSYRFVTVNGTYEVLVGSSCLDIRLQKEFSIKNKENYKDNIDIDLKEKYKNICQLNISSFDFYKLTNIKVNEEKEAITIETPFSDFKKTKKGKFAYKLIFMIYKNLVIPKIARSNKQLNKIKDNNLRDSLIKNRFFLLSMFDHNCPRSIFMASNGATNYHQILGMVDLANGKYFRAIKNFLTKDK